MSVYFTVLYRCDSKEELDKFFQQQIQPLRHRNDATKDSPVSVTGWHDGDALLEWEKDLETLKESITQCEKKIHNPPSR